MRSCFIHAMLSRVHRPPCSLSDSLLVVTGAGDRMKPRAFKHVGNIWEDVSAQVNRNIQQSLVCRHFKAELLHIVSFNIR